MCQCSSTCNNPKGPCLVACPDYNCVCPSGKLIDTEANECIDPSQCSVNCSVSYLQLATNKYMYIVHITKYIATSIQWFFNLACRCIYRK